MSRQGNVEKPYAQFLLVYRSTVSDAEKLAAAKVFFEIPPQAILTKASINKFKPKASKAQAKESSTAFTQAYKLLRRSVAQEADDLDVEVSDVSDFELSDDDDDLVDTVVTPEPNETYLKNVVTCLFSMMDDVEEEDNIRKKVDEIRSLLATHHGQLNDLLDMLNEKRVAYKNTGLIIAESSKNAFNTLERSFLCVQYLNANAFNKAWQQDQQFTQWVLAQRSNANGQTISVPVTQGTVVTSRASRSNEPESTLPAKISSLERRVSETASTTHIPTLFVIRKLQIECLAEYIKNPTITQTLQTRLFTSRAALTERFDYAMKRAHEKDKVFYMPLLHNMAFFDKYLLDQVYGKKKHASSRISYCIAFMKNVTVEYDPKKMDQPLIDLLKNLYRLKGLLLCEAHNQGSYLASLFHCSMTSALAKHVTSEISKIETLLRQAHCKKSGVATPTGNLARISGTNIDTDPDIQASRNQIQALDDAYGTRWRRFKTALFHNRPVLTAPLEQNLASTWVALNR